MYTPAFALLDRAATAAEEGRADELAALLAHLRRILDPDRNAQDMLPLYYLAGFAQRLEQQESINLYLRRFEQPQINLFYLLQRHLPLLWAGELANAHLVRHLSGHTTATLVSVGIGQARQECDLIGQAAALSPRLRELTVVAVEPALDSLGKAEGNLKNACAEAGVALSFHPAPCATEHLDEKTWSLIASSPRPLLVSASFALHHMQDPDPATDARDAFLSRLRSLSPAIVTICEPDSDHHRVPLRARFTNSWRMFHAVFEAIDSLPLGRTEHDAMKSFFGREIIDIVGATTESARYERHESTAAWLDRLRRCGFSLTPPPDTTAFRRTLAATPGFTLLTRPQHLLLGYRTTPLVAVMAATP